jgi:hypothetical protein
MNPGLELLGLLKGEYRSMLAWGWMPVVTSCAPPTPQLGAALWR